MARWVVLIYIASGSLPRLISNPGSRYNYRQLEVSKT